MSGEVEVVDPGVLRVRLPKPAAHAYVLLGRRIALVDSGHEETRGELVAALEFAGVDPGLVSLVLLTHEHADHVGGATAFPDALVVAHPLAAVKLRHNDGRATLTPSARSPDLELEHGSHVDLGGFVLRLMHTPGHSSGSICLVERERGLIFCGDTAFARGTLATVFASGSRGDHVASIDRLAALPARLLLPGHGQVSDDPRADLAATRAAAGMELADA